MADWLLVLALLQIKHFVADFPLQTATMRREKGYYGQAGGLRHTFVHVIGSALVLLPFLGLGGAVAAVLVAEGVTHYHLDWAKERIVRRFRLGMRTPGFWWVFGADQGAHQLTYLAMVAFLMAWGAE